MFTTVVVVVVIVIVVAIITVIIILHTYILYTGLYILVLLTQVLEITKVIDVINYFIARQIPQQHNV